VGFTSEENVEELADEDEKSPEVVPSLSVVNDVGDTKTVGVGGLVLSVGGKELDVGRAGGRFVLPVCCSKPLLKNN
jgi:hypothetical protein